MAAATEHPPTNIGGDNRYTLTDEPYGGSPTSTATPNVSGSNEHEASTAPEIVVGGGSAAGGGASLPSPTATSTSKETPKEVQEVLQSEIGIVTMLNRMKQSVSTAKEFANFLKKRAQLEEDYAAGMRKLARSTQDTMSRNDHNQGTFGQAFGEMMNIHSRMADNGYQFSMSLHQMHEDLLELASIAEKNRKGWKQTGLAAEQRVADLEIATRKSKSKYDALAEEYDRVRTGDAGGRRGGFGFKAKSGAQHEEDLLRKLQTSDEDYHSRVDTLSRERAELLATGRPEIIKALQDLVRECDGGMVLQVQKYASFSEKLLLSNGLSISPLKSKKPDARSLREVVMSIDSDKDLNHYIGTFHSKVPPKTGEPKYERHPVLGTVYGQATTQPAPPRTATGVPATASQPPPLTQTDTNTTRPIYPDTLQSPQVPPSSSGGPTYGSVGSQGRNSMLPPPGTGHERSFSYSSGFGPSSQPVQPTAPRVLTVRNSMQPSSPVTSPGGGAPPASSEGPSYQSSQFYASSPVTTSSAAFSSSAPTTAPSMTTQGPPQLGALPFQTTSNSSSNGAAGSAAVGSSLSSSMLSPSQSGPPAPVQSAAVAALPSQIHNNGGSTNPLMQHPPSQTARPVFGIALDVLYDRDSLAVPMVVYQCIQAVDLFGLNVEGIYRLSGSLQSVNKLKSMFDTDSSSPNLDFRNPENFFHDVNSVAGLLKQFFRDLPDPLLTREHYDRFIEAAQHDDDTVRRDSLHAVINDLPDPNYATLRAVILHLNRVVENASVNRMTAQNLAIVFGPTLLGTGTGDAEKGRWHVRIIDTILQNTYQIFDED